MLTDPEETSSDHKSIKRKKISEDSGKDEAEAELKALNEDPIDLILKNEHVKNMITVSKNQNFENHSNVFGKLLELFQEIKRW